MWVFGVEMVYSNPLQRSAKIFFHPLHEFAGQLLQIDSVPKLWRHDKFPQSGITLFLPAIQNLRWLNGSRAAIKTCRTVMSGAFAGDIPTVSAPLTSYLVLC